MGPSGLWSVEGLRHFLAEDRPGGTMGYIPMRLWNA